MSRNDHEGAPVWTCIKGSDLYEFIRASCPRYPLTKARKSQLLKLGWAEADYLKRLEENAEEEILIVIAVEPMDFGLAFMKDTGRRATSRVSSRGAGGARCVPPSFIRLLGEPAYTPDFSYDEQEKTSLRFQKLDRVRFNDGYSTLKKYWPMATVQQTWYREPSWLPGVVPYQFKADLDGDLRFARRDEDTFVVSAGKGDKARFQGNNIFQVWGRHCLHPRCTDWRAGVLTIPDKDVVDATGFWTTNVSVRAMPEPGVQQWTALKPKERYQIVQEISEKLVVPKLRNFVKIRASQQQLNILVPELFSSEGRDRFCGKGSVKKLVALLDGAAECEMCIEKKLRQDGTMERLQGTKLSVDARCPCPRRHARTEFFHVDTSGSQYCSDTGTLLNQTKLEGLWGTIRRCTIGIFATTLGVMAKMGALDGPNGPLYKYGFESIDKSYTKGMPPANDETRTNTDRTTNAKACNLCKKTEGGRDGIQLSRCSRCLKKWYCCREHQLEDWPQHKKECNKKPS